MIIEIALGIGLAFFAILLIFRFLQKIIVISSFLCLTLIIVVGFSILYNRIDIATKSIPLWDLVIVISCLITMGCVSILSSIATGVALAKIPKVGKIIFPIAPSLTKDQNENYQTYTKNILDAYLVRGFIVIGTITILMLPILFFLSNLFGIN